jgi:hypothetical protein
LEIPSACANLPTMSFFIIVGQIWHPIHFNSE